MRRYVLTYLILILCACQVYGQQEASNGLNFFNSQLYNPAITGSTMQNQFFLLNRTQWKDFNGPQIKTGTADYRINGKPISTGIIFNDQRAGAFKSTKVKLNYTHHLKLTGELDLLLGLTGGVVMNRFNVSSIEAIRIDDPVLMSGDRSTQPDFDGGALLKGEKFNTGISLTQLEGDMFAKGSVAMIPARQIVLHGNYNWQVDDDSVFVVTPLIITRLVSGTQFYYDANITASWNNMVWLGGGFRGGSTASFNVGLQFKNVRAGYAYEMQINALKGFVPPSHEIGLGYVFKSYSQSKQKHKSAVKTEQKEEKISKSSGEKQKADIHGYKGLELQRLLDELSEREDNLIAHEKQIYTLIDSLYTNAGKEKTKTNKEELERVARTQREVNRIKQELKQYTREKNVEIFKLKQRIEALRREIDAMEK